MAFSPVDLPIQEMLETDWMTDLSQIHNSNVLILKDKIEDLMNNFEIDINTISIGTDNPINSIRTQDLIMQDGGFIYQTGIPNQIIARLAKNVDGESVLTVNNISVDMGITAAALSVTDLTVTGATVLNGDTVVEGAIKYDSSLIESKEFITSLLEFDSVETAKTTITLTNTSKRNIYVTLNAETALGATQVWSGAAFNGAISNIKICLDFDASNPPAPNTSFTIYIVDVLENSASASILSDTNTASLPLSIAAGVNQATAQDVILHNDFATAGYKLSTNYSSANILSQALYRYGANATFNYIKDDVNSDRLMITSFTGLEVIN